MQATLVDQIRLEANSKLNPDKKSALGQFMTPSKIAEFMAGLFTSSNEASRLLDAGAGIGSLTIAAAKVLDQIRSITAWEIDPVMRKYLERNLETLSVPFSIKQLDFINDAVVAVTKQKGERFTHAILNPPYKKIGSDSLYRLLLREVGIETVNQYTAFLALSILLMEEKGEIVAIIPRSFCNGPYYKPFRIFLLDKCSIEHIHIFESRSNAFKDDEVLQENIILKLVKGKPQNSVKVSYSHDGHFSDYREQICDFTDIVKPYDEDMFIHIPTNGILSSAGRLFSHTLKDLGIEVSTGPVVDFRLKDFWLKELEATAVPLIYPHHFVQGKLRYPKNHRKPNALKRSPEVDKYLILNGFYVLVKRFSAKEEKKRVMSYVFNPHDISASLIGFENHWNVFHSQKEGLNEQTAKGLACFLNSTCIDQYFRVFSGHTQVNATDLKNMKYPSLLQIKELGSKYSVDMAQEQIDSLIEAMV